MKTETMAEGNGFFGIWKECGNMDKQAIKEKVQAIVAAPSCCAELKAVGEEWLAAFGTEREKAASETLIAERPADVREGDPVVAVVASPEGQKLFGAEKAAEMAQHMREVKAAGGKYCDCPACAPGREILDHQESLR